jgi:hypothetical protein
MSTLTDQQRLDCQRWMGYGITAHTSYGNHQQWEPLGLDEVLDELTSVQESTLVAIYLDVLAVLEPAIVSAADNLDTLKAGPWEANPREMAQREELFRRKCRELCGFLGFEPGPTLAGGSNSAPIVRC